MLYNKICVNTEQIDVICNKSLVNVKRLFIGGVFASYQYDFEMTCRRGYANDQ